jgi:hypothetical protein
LLPRRPVIAVAFRQGMTPMTPKRLRLVVFQEEPGLWLVRGLEHDLGAEARTIGEAIRAAMQFVQAHTAFDIRHDHLPLAAFPPAAQKYWNAYATGTPLSLEQLGIVPQPEWQIEAAFATRCPADTRPRATNLVFRGERSPARELHN